MSIFWLIGNAGTLLSLFGKFKAVFQKPTEAGIEDLLSSIESTAKSLFPNIPEAKFLAVLSAGNALVAFLYGPRDLPTAQITAGIFAKQIPTFWPKIPQGVMDQWIVANSNLLAAIESKGQNGN